MTWAELADKLRSEATRLEGQAFPERYAQECGFRSGMGPKELISVWTAMEMRTRRRLAESISDFATQARWPDHRDGELFFLEKRLRVGACIAAVLATPHPGQFSRVVPERPQVEDREAIEWLLIYCWESYGIEIERRMLEIRLEGMADSGTKEHGSA